LVQTGSHDGHSSKLQSGKNPEIDDKVPFVPDLKSENLFSKLNDEAECTLVKKVKEGCGKLQCLTAEKQV
jgi:hypothetical protein